MKAVKYILVGTALAISARGGAQQKVMKQCLDSVINPYYEKRVFFYNNWGENTQYTRYLWNNGRNWKEDYKYEYMYDREKNLTLQVYSIWNSISNNWIEKYKGEYTYDTKGNQTMGIEYYRDWDYVNNESIWVRLQKEEYAYDNKGNQTMWIIYFWDYVNNDWIWVRSQRDEYTYDDKENQIMWINSYWDYVSNDWIWYGKEESTYDTRGNIVIQTSYRWDNAANDWKNLTKKEYTHDANGYPTSWLYYIWEYNRWNSHQKEEYTYDAYGNRTMLTDYIWDYNEWRSGIKKKYIYDMSYSMADLVVPSSYAGNNKLTKIEEYSFDSEYSYWHNSGIIPYYWSAKDIDNTGISEITNEKNSIVVYPNPTNGQLKIENGEMKISDIEMFDIYGRNVGTKHLLPEIIDISHLSSGIYFLWVDGKIVKVIKN